MKLPRLFFAALAALVAGHSIAAAKQRVTASCDATTAIDCGLPDLHGDPHDLAPVEPATRVVAAELEVAVGYA